MNTPGKETEIKLPLPSLDGWPERLESAGFRCLVPPGVECSILYDRNQELFHRGCALRLRTYADRASLTWKGPKEEHPTFKIRPEEETEVGSPLAVEAILEALGFRAVLRMEKRRGIWGRREISACLDETPFGSYLELEGGIEDVRDALAELRLDECHSERRSYPELFRQHYAELEG